MTLVKVGWRLPFQHLLHQGVGKCTTPFPGLLHLALDPNFIILSARKSGIKYHFFWVIGMTWHGIEPWSPGPLVNILIIRANGLVWAQELELNYQTQFRDISRTFSFLGEDEDLTSLQLIYLVYSQFCW